MSQFRELDRPPLSASELRRALVRPGSIWTNLDVLPQTGSTNADLALRARSGAAEGAVLLAEGQSAGRGRLDRRWTSPPRAGIALSVLLRPRGVPVSRYGWLPLLAGVALVDAVGIGGLKWPNDLLIEGAKCAGILAEIADGAVIIGIGLNVTLRAEELPRPDATSLELSGAPVTDRGTLVKALLRSLEARYVAWVAAAGDPEVSGLRAAYRDRCSTLGRTVRVLLPAGGELTGTATDVDPDGRLVVASGETVTCVAAGDVLHVR